MKKGELVGETATPIKSFPTPKLIEVKHKYVWNVKTGEVAFSASWFTSLGYEPDELPHHENTRKSLLHPEDMPVVLGELLPVLNGRSKKFKAIYRLKKKDGSYRLNLDYAKVIDWDENGNANLMEGFDIPLAC